MPDMLPGGVFPPLPTFFSAAEELDLTTLATHAGWLAGESQAGLLALGSNGEAQHLDDGERQAVVTTVRAAIDQARPAGECVLLAGAGDMTTRGTIRRCQLVADAGAEVAVILPPFAFPTQMSTAALRQHFLAIADASPIPILLYNMPANTANIDMSADLIIDLARHPRIIGVKDSSGQVAKLAHIAANVRSDFAILAGSGSFLLPTLAVGGTGTIAAVANVVPALVAELYATWIERGTGDSATMLAAEMRARTLQGAIIPLNQAVTAGYGVSGLKAALAIARGYGGMPRKPLLPLTPPQMEEVRQRYADLVAIAAPEGR